MPDSPSSQSSPRRADAPAEIEHHAPRGADGVGDGSEPVEGAIEVFEVGGVPQRDDEHAVGGPPGAGVGLPVALGRL